MARVKVPTVKATVPLKVFSGLASIFRAEPSPVDAIVVSGPTAYATDGNAVVLRATLPGFPVGGSFVIGGAELRSAIFSTKTRHARHDFDAVAYCDDETLRPSRTDGEPKLGKPFEGKLSELLGSVATIFEANFSRATGRAVPLVEIGDVARAANAVALACGPDADVTIEARGPVVVIASTTAFDVVAVVGGSSVMPKAKR